jgi:hypothetical protein
VRLRLKVMVPKTDWACTYADIESGCRYFGTLKALAHASGDACRLRKSIDLGELSMFLQLPARLRMNFASFLEGCSWRHLKRI